MIYNTEDKKFVPHFNKWLKDKRWEEVIERKEKFVISKDPFESRIKMFVDAIKDGKVTRFLKSFAIQHKPDIDKGIKLGYLTKEEAIKELGMENEQKDGKYSALMQISGFITEESAQIYMSNQLKNVNQHIFMVESPPTIH